MAIFDKYTYIIAGTRQEATSCAKMHDRGTRFYHVYMRNQLMGLDQDAEVWACGEYDELKEWPEIEKHLTSRGIRPLHKVC